MTDRAANLAVVGIPDLGHTRRREQLVMSAQAFGLEVVTSGCASAEDMPSDEAYQSAASFALLLLGYMERGEPLPMDMLVNLLAERFHLAHAVGPSPRRRVADS